MLGMLAELSAIADFVISASETARVEVRIPLQTTWVGNVLLLESGVKHPPPHGLSEVLGTALLNRWYAPWSASGVGLRATVRGPAILPRKESSDDVTAMARLQATQHTLLAVRNFKAWRVQEET